MRSLKFYPRPVSATVNVKKDRVTRVLFLLGFLLLGVNASLFAQPSFNNGNPQFVDNICQNSSLQLNTYLTVFDASPTAQLTWSVTVTPSQGGGVLGGFPISKGPNVAGNVTPGPGNLTYTPNNNFTGTEFFTIQVSDGINAPVSTTIFVTVVAPPSVNVGTMPVVCAGTTTASISFSGTSNVGPVTQTFNFTGASQTFNVPLGVNSLHVDLLGAEGGNDDHSGAPNPGKGGRVQGDISVTPGSSFQVNVGGKGATPTGTGAIGGFNGGGNTFFYFYGSGGAGGGASDIRIGGTSLTDRILVAGGGGGNGWDNSGHLAGGDGGLIGGNSANNNPGNHAFGGTQSSGGAGATYPSWPSGKPGTLGNGGDGASYPPPPLPILGAGISGAGGGGYYGGGGGIWTGGGGGSSYANPGVANAAFTSGTNTGNGRVTVGYTVPGSTYGIVWSGAASTAGFVDVPSTTPLPNGAFVVNVPTGPTALPGTYHGTLRVNNTNCSSAPIDISVTISPVPVLNPIDNQVVCNGDTALVDVDFPGNIPFAVSWTNDNPDVGVAASGTSHIAKFPRTNFTNAPIQGVITVIPNTGICVGAASTFTITVNPTPNLNTTLHPQAICNNGTFNYTQTSLTTGGPVSYAWSRAAMTGLSNGSSNGLGDISEVLNDTTANILSVLYMDTVKANGCSSVYTVTVNVNPTPVLSTVLNPAPVCDSSLFTYVPQSNTPNTSFIWTRDVINGISNPLASGTGDPNEILVNTTAAPIGVTYTYTLTANGCTNVQTIVDTVYPAPLLANPLNMGAVCDSSHISFTPNSNVVGAVFSWSRDSVAGITNSSMIGTGAIDEYLYNNTAHQVLVKYVYRGTYNNVCVSTQTLTVVVNPRAVLIGSLPLGSPQVQAPICDSTLFSYVPTSFTVGTFFSWRRDSITGITNSSSFGTNNPNEILVNNTSDPIVVTYVFTLTAFGCSDTQLVKVTVNPKPMLSNMPASASICDSATFTYVPQSLTGGAAFNWYRAYVPGILDIAATGTGDPNETLINTTNVPVSVVYVYTVTANGCSNSQHFSVSVNPTPLFSSAKTGNICSDAPYTYVPQSFTTGATFSWQRPSVTGITPATASGTGIIHDSLHNSTLLPINVVYNYRLSINGCANNYTDKLVVTVKPKAPVPTISIFGPNAVCSNTNYQNFGASSPVPVEYNWTAENAVVWATGNTGQYAIISFPNPGTAVVMLNSNLPTVACTTGTTYTVTVSSSVAETPQVIYFDGQFICLQTTEDSYQWGYDDAGTLDSTILAGETNQNYANVGADMFNKKYWVMTTKGGCMQKTYYNAPTGVDDVNAFTGIKVYPNPTTDNINVDIDAKIDGTLHVEVMNMLGQKVSTATALNHKATINVSSLPSGVYLVDCYREGVKIAAARFVKN